MSKQKRFRLGQRVRVLRCVGRGNAEYEVNADGTVCRPRINDDGAWVALDKRSALEGAHPFPADDEHGRGVHVLAFPEDAVWL